MKRYCCLLLLVITTSLFAQTDTPTFREDQIYLSVAYPYFNDAPSSLIQNKLSYSLAFGVVRDMPLNRSRTLALGLGLGWDQTILYNNTRFSSIDNAISTALVDEGYQQNFLRIQSLAIPLELRWRNATETKHAFWRIHTGISLHVPLQLKSIYKTPTGVEVTSILPSNRTVLRWNLHFGFNTWNISIAHDIQPWASFDTSNAQFDMKFTKIGLIFYIL